MVKITVWIGNPEATFEEAKPTIEVAVKVGLINYGYEVLDVEIDETDYEDNDPKVPE